MNWLWEQPLTIVLLGGTLTLLLAFGWLQTRQRALAWSGLLVLALTAALLLVEQLVETESERISDQLHFLAAELEANRDQTILNHIDPDATATRRKAAAVLDRWDFQRARIKSNLELNFHNQQQVTASFNASGIVSGRGLGNMRAAVYVTVDLRKRSDRWLITDFEYFEAQRGLQTSRPR